MLIAIEGMDAAGKATHAALLAKELKGEVISFPDYSTPTGKAILGHLKEYWRCATEESDKFGTMQMITAVEDPLVFQALMTVNRLELLPRIYDLCKMDAPIIFDRYYGSALVYGKLDGLDVEWIKLIQAPLPEPDLWILLDIPPEESVRRRPERRDRYEKHQGVMKMVRAGYLELFSANAKPSVHRIPPWKVVNGVGTKEEVHERIMATISEADRLE